MSTNPVPACVCDGRDGGHKQLFKSSSLGSLIVRSNICGNSVTSRSPSFSAHANAIVSHNRLTKPRMHFDVVGAVRKPLGIPSKIESPEKIYKITEYFGAMNLKCLPKFTIAPNIRSFTDE